MKLYYYPGACSLAPHIVAREAGIPLTLEKVDLANRTTETGASYLAINPKGYVPALGLQDDSVLTEASAIIQYLADSQTAADLAPAERARAMRRVNPRVDRQVVEHPMQSVVSRLRPRARPFLPAHTPLLRR